MNVFPRFEYHIFYVLCPFLSYLLTHPRTYIGDWIKPTQIWFILSLSYRWHQKKNIFFHYCALSASCPFPYTYYHFSPLSFQLFYLLFLNFPHFYFSFYWLSPASIPNTFYPFFSHLPLFFISCSSLPTPSTLSLFLPAVHLLQLSSPQKSAL
jgi:hypothetical protein